MPTAKNAIRLFQIFGITVYLHWSWLIVVFLAYQQHKETNLPMPWIAAECLVLFGIVLMHEFGHALACRSVGGKADTIVLWMLGGVAYVSPPMRPGAMLWSIVAGPLVNVAMLVTLPFLWMPDQPTHLQLFEQMVAQINLVLLIFNLLPIYPLDGGKILWALLWYPMGLARSLMVATVSGMIAALGLVALGIYMKYYNYWLVLLAVWAGMNAWGGFQQARSIQKRGTIVRRAGVNCPSCGTSPPMGAYWACDKCGARFDMFQTGGTCPNCGNMQVWTGCGQCRTQSPFVAWWPASPMAGAAPPEAPTL